MKNKKIICFIIIMFFVVMLGIPNHVEAQVINGTVFDGYTGVAVKPGISVGTNNYSMYKSFILPAVSYQRKYAVRLVTPRQGAENGWGNPSNGITYIINSNSKDIFTIAAFDGNPGTGVLGMNGTVIGAVSRIWTKYKEIW